MPPSDWPLQALAKRVVHYDDLVPCTSAFIDTRTPGRREKENFTIIGPGVAENPEQHVHINIPHGFNIGGARQPPGCVNSQHSHETAEVFVVHSGRWSFTLGARCEDGAIELGPGDTISIPTNVFRGFTNVGDDVGFLFAVLGGDDPGHVTWAPDVFDQAKQHGLVLLENGQLIDVSRGETIPPGQRPMPATTDADVAALGRFSAAELAECVVRDSEVDEQAIHPFALSAGVSEASIIGAANSVEGITAGQINWPHGFQLRHLRIEPGATTPPYSRSEEEVVMVHRGSVRLAWEHDQLELTAGDVFTCPVGLEHSYTNLRADAARLYVVRGGDAPAALTIAPDRTTAPTG